MATAVYSRGELRMITHVAVANIAVDEILAIDNNVVVARANAAIGAHVQAAAGGVFLFPKVSGAEILAGERVAWDASEEAVEDNALTPAAGDIVGFAFATANAGVGETQVYVDLTPNAGVRT